MKPEHANSKIKFLSLEIKKHDYISAIFVDIFSRVLFLEFLARRLADSLSFNV